MEPVDYERLKPTRDYLQDVTKIFGKVQQAYIPAEPHEWHRGLIVTLSGVQTQELGPGSKISLDFRSGLITTQEAGFEFIRYSAQALDNTARQWIAKKFNTTLPEPELVTSTPTFDFHQGEMIADLLSFANQALTRLKQVLPGGLSSPVLLYPHHFDVSLSWYLNETQYTFGFSTGDETIREPYFYTTAYPEPKGFKKIPILEPAKWQKKGFKGFILKYNDAIREQQPEKFVARFFKAVTETTGK